MHSAPKLTRLISLGISLFLTGCAGPGGTTAVTPPATPPFDATKLGAIGIVAVTSVGSTAKSLVPIADQVATEMLIARGFRVAQRRYLNAAITELKLSETGMVDPSKAIAAGKLDGAAQILVVNITGYIRPSSKRALQVDIATQLVDVASGTVILASSGSSAQGSALFRVAMSDSSSSSAVRRAMTKALATFPQHP